MCLTQRAAIVRASRRQGDTMDEPDEIDPFLRHMLECQPTSDHQPPLERTTCRRCAKVWITRIRPLPAECPACDPSVLDGP